MVLVFFLIFQVFLVLQWVDGDFSIHEEFIGLYEIPTIEVSSLVFVIKDSLVCLHLTLSKPCGQCYNNASNMSGLKNGVTKEIRDEESRTIFTHCYCHSLSPAAGDTIKKYKTIKKAL